MSDMKTVEELASSPQTKIRAIKLYKDLTKEDLASSKRAVEHFAEHGQWPSAESPKEAAPELDLVKIEGLVAQDKMVKAIKLFRDSTGESLKTSKLTVEHFAKHGQWPSAPIEDGSSGSIQNKDIPPLMSTPDGRKAVGVILLTLVGIGGIFMLILFA